MKAPRGLLLLAVLVGCAPRSRHRMEVSSAGKLLCWGDYEGRYWESYGDGLIREVSNCDRWMAQDSRFSHDGGSWEYDGPAFRPGAGFEAR